MIRQRGNDSPDNGRRDLGGIGCRTDLDSHAEHTAIARNNRPPAQAQMVQRHALRSRALVRVVESKEGAVHT